MRNIWNNDEPERLRFTATCTASGECSVCIVAKLTHILVSSRWIWPCVYSGRWGCAVILMMLWHLKDFSFVLSEHNSMAVVARAAISNFSNTS